MVSLDHRMVFMFRAAQADKAAFPYAPEGGAKRVICTPVIR